MGIDERYTFRQRRSTAPESAIWQVPLCGVARAVPPWRDAAVHDVSGIVADRLPAWSGGPMEQCRHATRLLRGLTARVGRRRLAGRGGDACPRRAGHPGLDRWRPVTSRRTGPMVPKSVAAGA